MSDTEDKVNLRTEAETKIEFQNKKLFNPSKKDSKVNNSVHFRSATSKIFSSEA